MSVGLWYFSAQEGKRFPHKQEIQGLSPQRQETEFFWSQVFLCTGRKKEISTQVGNTRTVSTYKRQCEGCVVIGVTPLLQGKMSFSHWCFSAYVGKKRFPFRQETRRLFLLEMKHKDCSRHGFLHQRMNANGSDTNDLFSWNNKYSKYMVILLRYIHYNGFIAHLPAMHVNLLCACWYS